MAKGLIDTNLTLINQGGGRDKKPELIIWIEFSPSKQKTKYRVLKRYSSLPNSFAPELPF